MRLKTFKGDILEVTKVESVVEVHVKLNGKTIRLVEVARDNKQDVHALLFTFKEGQEGFGLPTENKLLIGNLPKEAVSSILDSLVTKGVADISSFSYQRTPFNPTAVTYDEGKSKPYYLDGFLATSGLNNCNIIGNSPFNSTAIKDDDYNDDLDELRAEIYEKTMEYSISDLASMCEAELLDILEDLKN